MSAAAANYFALFPTPPKGLFLAAVKDQGGPVRGYHVHR